VGETATLSVTATSPDNGTLTYQWQRATGASGGSFVNIPNATERTFTPNTDTAGVNRYRVVITNTNNASWIDGNRTARINSHVATVTVTTPAVITDPPLVDDTPPTTDPNVNYNPPTGGEPTQPLPFADVNPTDWFCPFVRAVWEQQLFNGVSPAASHPQSSMTRVMFVQVLANMEVINTNAYQASNSQSPRFYDTNSTASVVSNYPTEQQACSPTKLIYPHGL